MSIEIQCMTEKLIVITTKLDYSKVPCPPMPICYGKEIKNKINRSKIYCL